MDTIRSDFYKLELLMPSGWVGNFEGELPVLNVRKDFGEQSYRLRVFAVWAVDDIFIESEARAEFELTEEAQIKKSKVLLTAPKDRIGIYRVCFYQSSNHEDSWVWVLEIPTAISLLDQLKCDFSFVLEQLLPKN